VEVVVGHQLKAVLALRVVEELAAAVLVAIMIVLGLMGQPTQAEVAVEADIFLRQSAEERADLGL
jgi:hypothetical protein